MKFLKNFPLFLAPMAGISDFSFRQICKNLGADVLVSEFVSAEGILLADQRTRKYTNFNVKQRPVGIQLFGSEEEKLTQAAEKIIDWQKPDFIDLNFGCPVKKVVCKNGGAALLRQPKKIAKIAKSICSKFDGILPISAKIRSGWDKNSINALEICKILQDCGISFITIHGRTRAQFYKGSADWQLIKKCAQSINIPVIGNGDLKTPQQIAAICHENSIAGVMLGRAAIGQPWLFKQAKEFIKKSLNPTKLNEISTEFKWQIIFQHEKLKINFYQENGGNELQAMRAMRSQLMHYSKTLPNAKKLRLNFSKIISFKQLKEISNCQF